MLIQKKHFVVPSNTDTSPRPLPPESYKTENKSDGPITDNEVENKIEQAGNNILDNSGSDSNSPDSDSDIDSPEIKFKPVEIPKSITLTDETHPRGRKPGDVGVPQFLRESIAIAAHHDSGKNVAKTFGVSEVEVSLLKNSNMVNSKDQYGKDIKDKQSEMNVRLNEAVENDLIKVRRSCTNKLITVMDLLDEKRLSKVGKTKDLAMIGESFARILERITPKKNEGGDGTGVQFVFVVPDGTKKLTEYETIDVSPNVGD